MVVCDRQFFGLQLAFASRVSHLSGLSLPRTLLSYTNIYIRFGLGWGFDFDPDQPFWKEYLAGLQDAKDACEWTYDFYLARASQPVVPPPEVARFGCFSYERSDHGRIQLHFHNAETEGRSPLGDERLDRRLAELTELCKHVKQTEAHPLCITGASWLYNLEAYRRLFPASYVATARAVRRFQHFSLWGQFLDRHGSTRPDMADAFLRRLERQASLDGLEQCFSLQVLAVEAPMQKFYDFYGVD